MNKWPVRLGVRTSDFHSGNRGSIPLRATEQKEKQSESFVSLFVFICFLSQFFCFGRFAEDLFGFGRMLVVILYF